MPFNQQRSKTAQEEIQTAISILEEGNRLPETITARAQAISELAGTSLGTLYRHKGLWHPNHQNPESKCVIPDATVDTEPSEPPLEPTQEQLKPLQRKNLQTKEKIMKCSPPGGEYSFKKELKISSLRGVRGEQLRFPQVERPKLLLVPQPNFPHLPPTSGIDPEQDEVIQGIQCQVRSLGWTLDEIQTVIANKFGGKHRYQLSHEELKLLLCHLRDISTS